MQIKARRVVPWVAALCLASSACGLDEMGVLSIEFGLAPTAVAAPPEGLDGALLASMGRAGGMVTVDVRDDMGMVMVSGLPELPDGFGYSVMLMFAHGDRASLPGGGGHEDELETMVVGPLMAQEAAGTWMAMFKAADIDDHTMGALRAGMIMLMPETGMPVMIMFGQVQEEQGAESGGEGGGHEHGA